MNALACRIGAGKDWRRDSGRIEPIDQQHAFCGCPGRPGQPAAGRGIAVLKQVAHELRHEVLDTAVQTGGHLGSGLGVIELTVALHAVCAAAW